MSPSITNAFSEFATALMGIAFSLFHSVVAVTQAILALGIDIVHNILTLGRSVIKLAFDLFQGVFGFVAANIVAILVLGGGYYLYSKRQIRETRGT